MKVDPSYDAAYREHAKHVWAIVYRMTGSAQDADDLVQDTFVRAMARDASEIAELRPWLARIAINAAIDLLRQRRQRTYVGPWLPEPVDSEDESSEPKEPGADCRYDLLESASFAFLVALEALAPRARAVLLLRDVFDYSVREAADALAMTETHVKVTHHRARRIMITYEMERCVPTDELREQTRNAIAALMSHLATGDIAGIERLLAESVRTIGDSAGDYFAARVPVVGRAKVARFWSNTARGRANVQIRMINGLPAVVATLATPPAGIAPRTVIMLRLDATGLIRDIYTVVAIQKLTRLLGA